jgi:HPt (histidine-containing phosphotransfer) domain-containing protein
VKSTDYWPRPAQAPATAQNHFEQLRRAFYTRLRWDRARLASLSNELQHAEGDSALILDELRVVAHRICGAAAVFEAPEIGTAAYTLEQALLTAIQTHADRTDPNVSGPLDALLELLTLVSSRNP